jgi:hypothetical protein
MKTRSGTINKESIIVWTLETKPFVLSLSKHERRDNAPFDRLRVNGDFLSEEHWGYKRLSSRLNRDQLWTP